MKNPCYNWTKKEWLIWGVSLFIVLGCGLLTRPIDFLTLVATSVGITMLMFAAKGNVIGQFLSVIFCVLYVVISYRFRYFGEMITYLCMSMPIAIFSIITWLKNPTDNTKTVVKIRRFTKNECVFTCVFSVIVTVILYFVLKKFNTPNLIVSTISVATSFAAAYLTMRRISFYALAYALNDLVLIVLWVLASFENIQYIPVAVNFFIFLFNDFYGFCSWKKREREQC